MCGVVGRARFHMIFHRTKSWFFIREHTHEKESMRRNENYILITPALDEFSLANKQQLPFTCLSSANVDADRQLKTPPPPLVVVSFKLQLKNPLKWISSFTLPFSLRQSSRLNLTVRHPHSSLILSQTTLNLIFMARFKRLRQQQEEAKKEKLSHSAALRLKNEEKVYVARLLLFFSSAAELNPSHQATGEHKTTTTTIRYIFKV